MTENVENSTYEGSQCLGCGVVYPGEAKCSCAMPQTSRMVPVFVMLESEYRGACGLLAQISELAKGEDAKEARKAKIMLEALMQFLPAEDEKWKKNNLTK